MSYSVIIKDAVKKYGDFVAVRGVSLTVEKGEFFTLLGPSGCGKTTLLRMIAGFNTVDGGTISFDDRVMNHVAAHKRDTGMVFQNYAVFPHMNVADNVAYGLKARHMKKSDIEMKVEQALRLVQIDELKKRSPAALSGGQQQRVALARAFVIEPGVLLMDEPLSNLDAKLRVEMRSMIKKLQRDLGITTIYVTHDQEEALAISDRIAVMKDGLIQQIGNPEDIYRHPENLFVSNFIGNSNTFEGVMNGDELSLSVGFRKRLPGKSGSGAVDAAIRPEYFFFAEQGIEGEITLATFLGDFVCYEVKLSDGTLCEVNVYGRDMQRLYTVGEKVHLDFDGSRISVFRKDGGDAL